MTTLNIAMNPVKELCDYLHIWKPWLYRMENIITQGDTIHTLDLVTTTKNVDKIFRVVNMPGLGFVIEDIEEVARIPAGSF